MAGPGSILLNDRNGNNVTFETQVLPDGNTAQVSVISDPSGNRANMAPGGSGAQLTSSDGTKATYRYSVTGITPVATPTDIFIIQGSATRTVRLKRLKISGAAATAGQLLMQLIRRSTAGTPGSATLTAITAAKHDINDVAGTAVVSYVQTANYSVLGTTAGQLGVGRTFLNVAATGPTTDVIWDFATRQDKAIILRGTSDFVCVNANGATVPASGVLDIEVETEEDNS